MEAVSRKRFVRISPKKLQQVCEVVRGKDVEEAMRLLPFMKQRGAQIIHKALKSAVSNALNLEGVNFNEDSLVIKKIVVDKGPVLHRFRAGALGRVKRIKHRLSHLTITVSEKNE
ncbi:50S ribosomal protein L22 [bacterium]|nr:50S ribosomal protein L22 [bacterium]